MCIRDSLKALLLAKLLFRALFGFLGAAHIDFFGPFSGVYQNGDTVIHDFCKTCANGYVNPAAFFNLHPGIAYADRDYHVLMVRQNTHFSVRSRKNQFPAASYIEDSVTCYYFQAKCCLLYTSCASPGGFCIIGQCKALSYYTKRASSLWKTPSFGYNLLYSRRF